MRKFSVMGCRSSVIAIAILATLPVSFAGDGTLTYSRSGSDDVATAVPTSWNEQTAVEYLLQLPDGSSRNITLDPALLAGTTFTTSYVDEQGWTHGTITMPTAYGSESYEASWKEDSDGTIVDVRPIGSTEPPVRAHAICGGFCIAAALAAAAAVVYVCAENADEHRDDCAAQCNLMTCPEGQAKSCGSNVGGCGMIGASCDNSCVPVPECSCAGEPLCDCYSWD